MATFGELVREYREALGLSRERVSQVTGLSLEEVAAIEAGRGWPLWAPMGWLAQLLAVDERELVSLAEAEQWDDGPRLFSLYDCDPDGEVRYLTRARWRELRSAYRQARRDAERRRQSGSSRGYTQYAAIPAGTRMR